MYKRLPLEDEYVIFTGILRSSEAVDLVLQQGGNPVVAPFIATQEIVSQEDEQKLTKSLTYDWLIFTSQSSVHAFHAKMKKYRLGVYLFKPKIAVVGSKTAAAVEKIGFTVNFTPSIFCADAFVKEFPAVISSNETCLFLKGNLAKNTITVGIENLVDEWTIYETVEVEENKEQVRNLIEINKHCSVIFTSPSAVDVFHRSIGTEIGYDSLTICALGHITKDYLQSLGATVQVTPKTYTLTEVIHALVEWKGRE